MTVKTGDLVNGMLTGVPVMQVESGIGSVAFKAYERLGRGRQIFQNYQSLEIASNLDTLPGLLLNQLFSQVLDSKATGAMAGFTIHQWHAGFFLQLYTHGAGVKEEFQPIMLMTGCQTVLGTDVISIEVADNHFFIFAYRQDWF
jgi:hypothetical protein